MDRYECGDHDKRCSGAAVRPVVITDQVTQQHKKSKQLDTRRKVS
jgi:hypothetical protein